jgi:hypothetical protein
MVASGGYVKGRAAADLRIHVDQAPVCRDAVDNRQPEPVPRSASFVVKNGSKL